MIQYTSADMQYLYSEKTVNSEPLQMLMPFISKSMPPAMTLL